MKFMKLGSRPDTFITTEAVRSVSSEVSTDIRIHIKNSSYQLHKFPLLSKCGLLQALCSRSDDSDHPTVIHLPDIPGGEETFELCAKFCYGIAITVSPLNFVPLRCAAAYLQMTDAVDRGNLAGKLESFFKSCILRRWKDTLVTLQSTMQHSSLSEELRITPHCIEALADAIVAGSADSSDGWWAEDVAELGVDHFWRILLAVKSAGVVSDKIIGEALEVYAGRWLPPTASAAVMGDSDSPREITFKNRLLLEKIVSLLPAEKGSASCSFLLKLLRAANILNASSVLKLELARRAGAQLEDSAVSDLLIPSISYADEPLYDVDIVTAILEEFMLQGRSPPTSPPRGKHGGGDCRRRRSRSAENVDFEGQENGRRSSSASHSSKLRVAKLIDLYLLEIAGDANLPLEKIIKLAETVPEFARTDHDDLYRAIDSYLRVHPDLDKNERKKLCRILDCKKLSVEACMHAAQNEKLPLRVVVQVLFFEQARAAIAGGKVAELPSSIRALLAKTAGLDDENGEKKCTKVDDECSAASDLKCPSAKLATLRMKLAEEDDDADEEAINRDGLMRSSSSKIRALCSIPSKSGRILSKFWSFNRIISDKHKN